MATITKTDLEENLFDTLGLNKREGKDVVENLFEVVKATLENGEHVKLSGFGNFCLRDKKERPGRNPKTGEKVSIAKRRVVTFRAGQKLRSKVKRYGG